MSLTVETGVGVQGAESYASVAFIDAYWTARAHDARATAWAAASTPHKEGAARECTAYIDGLYGSQFKGQRAGYVQGLEWPRSNALDEAGYPLPLLPTQLASAVAELAPTALTGRLAPDTKAGGGVLKRVKAGSVEVEFADNGKTHKEFTAAARMLAPLLAASTGYYFG